MKKISKFIYFMLAFALITCMAIFNPAITFVDAATEADSLPTNSISISTGKMDSTVEAGENMYIPRPDVKHASGAKVYTVVKDRSGKSYTYNWTEGTGDLQYFTKWVDKTTEANGDTVADDVEFIQPKFIGKGTYTVQHKAVVGEGETEKAYYSNAQMVQVKGVAYSWQFNKDNEVKNIVPSITNVGTEFELPLPTIINSLNDADNKVYTSADRNTNIVVTKGGANVTTTLTRADADTNKLYFTPVLDEGEESATFIITYKSKVSAFANRTYTVKVDRNYDSEAKLEVSHNSITNVQVGATTTFPTPNVTDKTHNKTSVEVNSTIIVKKGSETIARLQPNQFNYKFENSGTYTIYYEVEDVYGNKATSAGYSITVNNRAPYEVDYAKDYTTQDVTDGTVTTDVSYLIPCEVGYSGFTLPAIYAEDYVTGYEDLKFSRTIELSTDSSVYFDLDSNDAEHGNQYYIDNPGEYDADNIQYNKAVQFRFPGTAEQIKEKYANCTFKVKYAAKGEGDSYAYATVYTIKIADTATLSYNVDKNMIVNFPTINSAIDPNAELSFTSATAKEEPTDSKLVADERVETKTYYYCPDMSVFVFAFTSHIESVYGLYEGNPENTDKYNEKYGYGFDGFIAGFAGTHLTELNANGGTTALKLDKTQFDALNADKQDKVTVFAVAINDQGQFLIKAQEVAINNTDEDDLPYIVNATDYTTGTTYNQNVTVDLPKVSFQDLTDKNLEVEVRCYVDTPDQTVGITIQKFIADTAENLWGIEDASLTTTYAGRYYVVYTATDDAGNSASYISTFEVAKTEKAYLEVENGSNISKLVGEEVVFNINLAGNGTYTNFKPTITWGENKPSGLGSQPNSFKFDKAGTYVATISAKYTLNGQELDVEPSVTVTVTVKTPELKWEDSITELLTDRTAEEGEKIELPVISAVENGVEINAVPTVVFIDKDDKETEVEVVFDETSFNNYYFTAENDGVYKVTYTATTEYNSSTKTFNVTCGDYYAPTVIINNNKLQDSNIKYDGTDIKFQVESFKQEEIDEEKQAGKYILTVTATAGETKLFGYDIKVTLKDVDADKNIVDLVADSYTFTLTGDNCSKDSTNNWTIKGVGKYTLKLTVKDTNGNSDDAEITFKVSNKTEPKSIKDNVVGIVLIVVSVVILGGVILFFALAGKRNKSKRKSVKADK